jgi:hypothetical protein
MDVFPWPGGHGFSGRNDWWRYLLHQEEAYRLDVLITLAFMHEDIRKRLLDDRDIDLMAMFQLSLATIRWLAQVEAHTITDLALAVALRQQRERIE